VDPDEVATTRRHYAHSKQADWLSAMVPEEKEFSKKRAQTLFGTKKYE
jgi:hypothetical protein